MTHEIDKPGVSFLAKSGQALAGDDAVAALARDPFKTYFLVDQLAEILELERSELVVELEAGRLAAVGHKTDAGDWRDVTITGGDLIAWLTSAKSDVADKAREILTKKTRLIAPAAKRKIIL